MQQIFVWLESTGLARAVGESLWTTAWLSAFHLIGFTLVMSSGLIWNLSAARFLLSTVPTQSIARPARRFLIAGLTISLLTGFALFAPRASHTAPTAVFQLKMLFLVLATGCQLILNMTVLHEREISAVSLRVCGVVGLLLWLSLAVTACWFILFE